VRRLREGTWPGHILEHVTLELQNQAGMKGNFGKARETSQRGVYKVVVMSGNQVVSRAALLAARDLVMSAIDDRPFDVKAAPYPTCATWSIRTASAPAPAASSRRRRSGAFPTSG
jgi:cyanophycin synthetase